jgi:hypothetical protein
MKKSLFFSLAVLLCTLLLASCAAKPDTPNQRSTHTLQEWIQVGDYDIFVHQYTQQQNIVDGKRLVSIEVEYANNRSLEELSCRRNQWYLYDTQGHSYEAESDWFNEEYKGDLYEMTNLSYLGGDHVLSQNGHLRGWLIFVVPEETSIEKIQFMTEFLDTKTADILVRGTK